MSNNYNRPQGGYPNQNYPPYNSNNQIRSGNVNNEITNQFQATNYPNLNQPINPSQNYMIQDQSNYRTNPNINQSQQYGTSYQNTNQVNSSNPNYPSQPLIGNYPVGNQQSSIQGNYPSQPGVGNYPVGNQQSSIQGNYPSQPIIGNYPVGNQPSPIQGNYPSQPLIGNYAAIPGTGYGSVTNIREPQNSQNSQNSQHNNSCYQANTQNVSIAYNSNVNQNSNIDISKLTLECLRPIIKRPNQNINSQVTRLYKSMKGIGCNLKEMINILCSLNLNDRLLLRFEYNKIHQDLIKKIKSETSFENERLCLSLLYNQSEFYAYCVYKSVKGIGTDDIGLIETLCCRNNFELSNMKTEYKFLFNITMEEAIRKDTSGTYKDFLLEISKGIRNENNFIDMNLVQSEAYNLYKKSKKLIHNGNEVATPLFSKQSYLFIRQLSLFFEKTYEKSLESHLSSAFKGNYKKVLIQVCQFSINPHGYFAKRLKKAINKLDVRPIIRIFVGRQEIDILNIVNEYSKLFNEGIIDSISVKLGPEVASWVSKLIEF